MSDVRVPGMVVHTGLAAVAALGTPLAEKLRVDIFSQLGYP
jgi:hypothetical protein